MAPRATKSPRGKKAETEVERLISLQYVGLLEAAIFTVISEAKARGVRLTRAAIFASAGVKKATFYRVLKDDKSAGIKQVLRLRDYLLSLNADLPLPPPLERIRTWEQFLWYQTGDELRVEFPARFTELLGKIRSEIFQLRSAARAKAEADAAFSGLVHEVSEPPGTTDEEATENRQPPAPIARHLSVEHGEEAKRVGRSRGTPSRR